MDNLGSMEPEQLLQFVAGSITCAIVIFLFIIVYVLITRQGKGAKKPASYRRDAFHAEYRAESASPSELGAMSTLPNAASGAGLYTGEASSIDVSARLAGTGREAWLEQEAPDSSKAWESDDHAPPDPGQEVLRVLRDPLTGQIWVQVAGIRYRSLNEVRDRAVGERVLAAITHFLRFSNGMAAGDQGIITLHLPPCDAVPMPIPFGVLSGAREPDELIRLMSNPHQGHFCVYVVDRCYRRLVEVSDRATGQFVLAAITRLLQFSNGKLATNDGAGVVPVPPLAIDIHPPIPTPAAPSAQITAETGHTAYSGPNAASQPVQASPVSSYDSAGPVSEQDRFLQQMTSQIPSEPETYIERPSLMTSFRRMRQKSSAELLPQLNLADEIDHIFQDKLVASGMTRTAAKVEANPGGGVRIRVGTVYYDSPDEVPDPQLRDVLKLSIAEWNQG